MAEAIAKFPATLIGKSEQPHAGDRNTILTFEVAGVGLAKLAVSKEDAELFPFVTAADVQAAKAKGEELQAGSSKAYVFVLVEQEKAPDFIPEPAIGGDPAPPSPPPDPTPTPTPDPTPTPTPDPDPVPDKL